MATTHPSATTVALIVCLVGTQLSGPLVASEEKPSSSAAAPSQSAVNSALDAQGRTEASGAAAVSSSEQPARAPELPWSTDRSRFTLSEVLGANGPFRAVSPQVWGSTLTFAPVGSGSFTQRGYRGRGRGGRNGAATAIVLGAVASIAGGAVLVYANRPECSINHSASGCGYGTKVIGGAVLSAGIVGLVVGAVTWR